MRDEVLMDLVDRALSDEEFRSRAKDDPEGTLAAYGYELTDEELGAVKEFQSQVAGLSDEELEQALASGARRQGG
jgi:Ribosomally synthesized peptide prototyped by Frankia Franean1_4349.